MSTFPGPFATGHVVTATGWNLARDAVELNEANIAANAADIAANAADIAALEPDVALLMQRVLSTDTADRLVMANSPIWSGPNMVMSSIIPDGALVEQQLPGSVEDCVAFPLGNIPNGTIIQSAHAVIRGPAYSVPTSPVQVRLVAVSHGGVVTTIGSGYDVHTGADSRAVGAFLASPFTVTGSEFLYVIANGAAGGTGGYMFYGAYIIAR